MIRRLNPAVVVGSLLAIALYVVFREGWLNSWTPLEGTYQRDYITLPRCGLAVRFGTNMFTSSTDYPWYGPVGTGWASHPALCVFGGVPTSYLSPNFGFQLLNFFYLLVQLGIIVVFGRRLTAPYRVKDVVMFAALALFFPWYVMYVAGQYHALSVLALALVLSGPRHRVGGFVLSAISKPALGPAGLVLILRGHFRQVLKIALWVALLTLPFAIFGYTKETGIHSGGSTLHDFLKNGTDYTKYFIPNWDQEISFALLLDQFVEFETNLHLREYLTAALILFAAIGLRKRPIEVAIATATMWFFIFYARGHEYQGTLMVPIFAYLFTEPRGLYRNWWLVLLAVVYALPTPWPIFIHKYDLAGPGPDSFAFMKDHSRILFDVFLAQKPATAILVIFTIAWTELRPRRSEAPAPAPAATAPAKPAYANA